MGRFWNGIEKCDCLISSFPTADLRLNRSLLLRLGLALSAIFMLAVVGMLSSVFIAETAKGYAAAINQAGTLRMQSYRIASSLVHDSELVQDGSKNLTRTLVDEFNQRLTSPRIHKVLSKHTSQRVLDTYHRVEKRWRESIYPLLTGYLAPAHVSGAADIERLRRENKQGYLVNVDGFVSDIHAFVEALEIDAEQKNQQLRIIQLISLTLIFVVASVSFYLAKARVLKPLRDLLHCANAARRGDFSVRSEYLMEDELGQLGQAFNVMAEDLSKMYEDLEARVKHKTEDLERSNRSLELLYQTTKSLSDSSLSDEVLERVIRDIQQLMGWEAGTICLGQAQERESFRLVTTNPIYRSSRDLAVEHCATCLAAGRSQVCRLDGPDSRSIRVFATPIRDQQQQFGTLQVEVGEDQMDGWQQRLLETVASHIALAINLAQQASQARLVSLLEERSVIARELHDSLAQSLSYLKIQVSRLEKAVRESVDPDQVLALTQVLRSALNGAYRQLRDLLTTFRLRIDAADFGITLRETVEEFSKKGDIDIRLKDGLANCRLGPNAEIHLIQIIREALSNVIRHAQATRAMLILDCDQAGIVTMLIEDDGVGLSEQHDMMQHYGLPIMQERAEWLGGSLQIENTADRGTRIRLTFSSTDQQNNLPHNGLIQKLGDV